MQAVQAADTGSGDRRQVQRCRTRRCTRDPSGGDGAGGRGQTDQAGASKLPAGKTWDTFEHDRTPIQLRQQLDRLGEGDFVDHGVNVLAFGMPGTGKTHAMCAIGHRLVESSRSVLFIPAYRLVQSLPRRRPGICWQPRETWSYPGCSESWTTSTCW
ncbi:MAG: ATP-binding protein [Dehalococcoidia bacterium]|nr:ATP-binding protein [Dehalococcoidia bacterium]